MIFFNNKLCSLQMSVLFHLVAAAAFLTSCVDAARILAIFPTSSSSHTRYCNALSEALAAKGHELTVISVYPLKTNLPNYKNIQMENLLVELSTFIHYHSYFQLPFRFSLRLLRFSLKLSSAISIINAHSLAGYSPFIYIEQLLLLQNTYLFWSNPCGDV